MKDGEKCRGSEGSGVQFLKRWVTRKRIPVHPLNYFNSLSPKERFIDDPSQSPTRQQPRSSQ